MALTDQKRRYAEARLAGMTKKASAIKAGCPEKTASQAASRYEKDADVIAHMKRQTSSAPEPEEAPKMAQHSKNEPESSESEAYSAIGEALRRGFKDPLDFMEAMMNDIAEDPKLRLDAAKSLAAYRHAKPGDRGKKGEKQDAAKQAAKGKFRAAPPPLKAVK